MPFHDCEVDLNLGLNANAIMQNISASAERQAIAAEQQTRVNERRAKAAEEQNAVNKQLVKAKERALAAEEAKHSAEAEKLRAETKHQQILNTATILRVRQKLLDSQIPLEWVDASLPMPRPIS